MNTVNWSDYIPSCIVVFSTLTDPDNRADIDDEVAGLVLLNDFKINITWDHKKKVYTMRVYIGSMRNEPIAESQYHLPAELIRAAVSWSIFAEGESSAPVFSAPSQSRTNQIALRRVDDLELAVA